MDSFSVEFDILGSEKIDTFFCRIKKKCRKKCRKKKVIKSESDVTLEITPPFIIGFFALESSYSVQCFSVYYAKISPFRGDFALKKNSKKIAALRAGMVLSISLTMHFFSKISKISKCSHFYKTFQCKIMNYFRNF